MNNYLRANGNLEKALTEVRQMCLQAYKNEYARGLQNLPMDIITVLKYGPGFEMEDLPRGDYVG